MSLPVQGHAAPSSARLRPEASNATRYLCAAAHLDENFASVVLDEVLYERHRAIAPSHGVSLVPVVRHCLAAQRRTLRRDALVAAALVLGLLVSATAGLSLALTLLSVWLVVNGFRLLARKQTSPALISIAAGFVVAPLLAASLLLGPLGLSQGLSGFFFGVLLDPAGVLARWFGWILILLLIWALYFLHRLSVHRIIAVDLAARHFDPQHAPRVDPLSEQYLSQLDDAQRGNLTLYSEQAADRPFIGFGDVARQWAMVAQLQPERAPADIDQTSQRDGLTSAAPTRTGVAIPFSTEEIYDAIRTGMVDLAQHHQSYDEPLSNFSVRDRVFASGTLSSDSLFVDRGHARSRLSEQEMQAIRHTERGPSRHYLAVRMVAWDGELEVTSFIHVTQRAGLLFVEFVSTVMPGIHPVYRSVDTVDRLDAAARWRAARRAFSDVLRSPRAILALLTRADRSLRRASQQASEDERINRQLAFDYGARVSIRELSATPGGPVGFQVYDADERIRVVEHRLIDVLARFLNDHHYDLSPFTGQMQTVINSTRIENSNTFNNSTLNSSSVAAGSSASATSNAAPAAQSPSRASAPPSKGP